MEAKKIDEIERGIRAMKGAQVEKRYLERLFESDNMLEYAKITDNSELFCNFLNEFGIMFDYYIGENPRAAIELNELFTYKSFKVMAEKFKEKGKEGLSKVLASAFKSMLYLGDIDNADKQSPELEIKDMEKYMPLLKEWLSRFDKKELIKIAKGPMASNIESIVINKDYYRNEGAEYLELLAKKQLVFLGSLLGKRDFKKMFAEIASEPTLMEELEHLGYASDGASLDWEVKEDKTEGKSLTVYMMIGLPASGKSAVYDRDYRNIPVVSKDLFKGSAAKERKELESLLGSGKDVVVDDTNYNKKARAKIFDIALKYNARVVGVYITTDKETALKRNEKREKKVPPAAIHKIAKEFEEPQKEEGFAELRYVFE